MTKTPKKSKVPTDSHLSFKDADYVAHSALCASQWAPSFYPKDQELWCVAANKALTSQAITDQEAKFNQLVAQLTHSATMYDWDLILNPRQPTSAPPSSLPSSAPLPSLQHNQRPQGLQLRRCFEGINSRNNGHFSHIYIAFSFQDCKWYINTINTTVGEQIKKLEELNIMSTIKKEKEKNEDNQKVWSSRESG